MNGKHQRMTVGVALLVGLSGGAWADIVTKRVTIKPIQVRNDDGMMPANAARELNEAAVDKIWKQAGIDIMFLDWMTLDMTDRLNATDQDDDDSFTDDYADLENNGGSDDEMVINMWFVKEINPDGAGTTFGVSALSANRILIADAGVTRLDTIAHEIGHSLGLTHASAGGDDNNLMRNGNDRNVPTDLDDIGTVDKLTEAQIMTAMNSGFVKVIPAPGPLALVGFGALFSVRRRRAA